LKVAAPLLMVFGIAAIACVASIAMNRMPSPPGIGVLAIIVLALVVALHGVSAGFSDPRGFFVPFAIALVVCGVCGAVMAVLQIFAVDSLDNVIIALPPQHGRAVGNIGQSNQFADTMLWGLVGLVPLARAWQVAGGSRLARAAWGCAAVLMLLGVVLTGSRTALIALLFIAAWGLADRQLAKPLRVGLALAPIVAGMMLPVVAAWERTHNVAMALTDRGDAGITAYRSEIWSNALSLIKEQPWLGVGWGQFNFAWSLTPFANREAGLVDNVHDLPLQLAVELGVPAALLMMGLLVAAMYIALRRVWRLTGDAGLSARAALVIVAMMGLHSMLEYPLWYAYMLLPTAWAFGLALGTAAKASPVAPAGGATLAGQAAAPLRAWRPLGLMMVVLAGSAWMDYLNVVSLFLPTATSLPFPERIQRAQASPLFSNQADYVAITQNKTTPAMLPMIQRTSRVLVNSRLLFAWSNALYAEGETDKARYLAARMREFNLVGARDWFNVCDDPAVAPKPFQCLPPAKPVSWRDFR